MAETFVSERNLEFMLFDLFDLESLTEIPCYEDHSHEAFRMVLDTALKMGREMEKYNIFWIEEPVSTDDYTLCLFDGAGGLSVAREGRFRRKKFQKKTITVVTVEARMAMDTSRVPTSTACFRSSPRWMWR